MSFRFSSDKSVYSTRTVSTWDQSFESLMSQTKENIDRINNKYVHKNKTQRAPIGWQSTVQPHTIVDDYTERRFNAIENSLLSVRSREYDDESATSTRLDSLEKTIQSLQTVILDMTRSRDNNNRNNTITNTNTNNIPPPISIPRQSLKHFRSQGVSSSSSGNNNDTYRPVDNNMSRAMILSSEPDVFHIPSIHTSQQSATTPQRANATSYSTAAAAVAASSPPPSLSSSIQPKIEFSSSHHHHHHHPSSSSSSSERILTSTSYNDPTTMTTYPTTTSMTTMTTNDRSTIPPYDRKDFDQLKETVNTLNDTMRTLETTVPDQHTNNKLEMNKLQLSTQDKVSDRNLDLKTIQDQYSLLESKLKDSKSLSLSQYTQLSDDIHSRFMDISTKMNQDRDSTLNRLCVLEEYKATHLSSNTSLQDIVYDLQKGMDTIQIRVNTWSDTQVSDLNTRIDQLEGTIKTQESKVNSSIDSITHQLQHNDTRLNTMVSSVTDQYQMIDELKSKQVTSAEEQLKWLNKMNIMEQTIQSLTAQQELLSQQCLSYEQLIADLVKKSDALEEKYVTSQEEIQTVQNQFTEYDKELSVMKITVEGIGSLQTAFEELKSEQLSMSNINQEVSYMKDELLTMKGQMERIDELQTVYEQLKSDQVSMSTTTSQEVSHIKDELTKIRGQIVGIDALETVCKELKSDQEKTSKIIGDVDISLSDVQSKIMLLGSQIKDVTVSIEKVESAQHAVDEVVILLGDKLEANRISIENTHDLLAATSATTATHEGDKLIAQDLKENLAVYDSKLNEFETNIKDISDKLKTVTTQVRNENTSKELLSNTVTVLDEKLSDISTRMNEFVTKEALQSKLDELEACTNEAKDDLTKIQNELQQLSTTVTELHESKLMNDKDQNSSDRLSDTYDDDKSSGRKGQLLSVDEYLSKSRSHLNTVDTCTSSIPPPPPPYYESFMHTDMIDTDVTELTTDLKKLRHRLEFDEETMQKSIRTLQSEYNGIQNRMIRYDREMKPFMKKVYKVYSSYELFTHEINRMKQRLSQLQSDTLLSPSSTTAAVMTLDMNAINTEDGNDRESESTLPAVSTPRVRDIVAIINERTGFSPPSSSRTNNFPSGRKSVQSSRDDDVSEISAQLFNSNYSSLNRTMSPSVTVYDPASPAQFPTLSDNNQTPITLDQQKASHVNNDNSQMIETYAMHKVPVLPLEPSDKVKNSLEQKRLQRSTMNESMDDMVTTTTYVTDTSVKSSFMNAHNDTTIPLSSNVHHDDDYDIAYIDDSFETENNDNRSSQRQQYVQIVDELSRVGMPSKYIDDEENDDLEVNNVDDDDSIVEEDNAYDYDNQWDYSYENKEDSKRDDTQLPAVQSQEYTSPPVVMKFSEYLKSKSLSSPRDSATSASSSNSEQKEDHHINISLSDDSDIKNTSEGCTISDTMQLSQHKLVTNLEKDFTHEPLESINNTTITSKSDTVAALDDAVIHDDVSADNKRKEEGSMVGETEEFDTSNKDVVTDMKQYNLSTIIDDDVLETQNNDDTSHHSHKIDTAKDIDTANEKSTEILNMKKSLGTDIDPADANSNKSNNNNSSSSVKKSQFIWDTVEEEDDFYVDNIPLLDDEEEVEENEEEGTNESNRVTQPISIKQQVFVTNNEILETVLMTVPTSVVVTDTMKTSITHEEEEEEEEEEDIHQSNEKKTSYKSHVEEEEEDEEDKYSFEEVEEVEEDIEEFEEVFEAEESEEADEYPEYEDFSDSVSNESQHIPIPHQSSSNNSNKSKNNPRSIAPVDIHSGSSQSSFMDLNDDNSNHSSPEAVTKKSKIPTNSSEEKSSLQDLSIAKIQSSSSPPSTARNRSQSGGSKGSLVHDELLNTGSLIFPSNINKEDGSTLKISTSRKSFSSDFPSYVNTSNSMEKDMNKGNISPAVTPMIISTEPLLPTSPLSSPTFVTSHNPNSPTTIGNTGIVLKKPGESKRFDFSRNTIMVSDEPSEVDDYHSYQFQPKNLTPSSNRATSPLANSLNTKQSNTVSRNPFLMRTPTSPSSTTISVPSTPTLVHPLSEYVPPSSTAAADQKTEDVKDSSRSKEYKSDASEPNINKDTVANIDTKIVPELDTSASINHADNIKKETSVNNVDDKVNMKDTSIKEDSKDTNHAIITTTATTSTPSFTVSSVPADTTTTTTTTSTPTITQSSHTTSIPMSQVPIPHIRFMDNSPEASPRSEIHAVDSEYVPSSVGLSARERLKARLRQSSIRESEL